MLSRTRKPLNQPIQRKPRNESGILLGSKSLSGEVISFEVPITKKSDSLPLILFLRTEDEQKPHDIIIHSTTISFDDAMDKLAKDSLLGAVMCAQIAIYGVIDKLINKYELFELTLNEKLWNTDKLLTCFRSGITRMAKRVMNIETLKGAPIMNIEKEIADEITSSIIEQLSEENDELYDIDY